jgi:hypothetical protein
MTVHQVLTEERKTINTLARVEKRPVAEAAEVAADEFDVIEFCRVLDRAVRI